MPVAPLVVITDTDLGDTDIEQEILEAAGFRLSVAQCRTEDEVVRASHGAAGLLVQFAPVGAAAFAALPDLRAVVRYGTGLDTIDLAAAASSSVAVAGIAGYCTDEVADHAMALLLAAIRGVTVGSSAVRSGEWPSAEAVGPLTTLRDKTLGIIGFGRIGRAVAERARAFGMQIGAYDPAFSPAQMEAVGVRPLDIKEAFSCDAVSLHLPLTPETAGLVDRSLLSQMPKGSVLVNVSRGGLVNEEDLLAALDEERPWFAALDVLSQEPARAGHPLVCHPRVIVTPHLGFYSTASLRELRRLAAERVVELLQT